MRFLNILKCEIIHVLTSHVTHAVHTHGVSQFLMSWDGKCLFFCSVFAS